MRRIGPLYLCAGLFILTFVVYLPLWHNGFIDFDDDEYITANPEVIHGVTPASFAWAWTTYHGNYWQPLSWLSLQVDASLFSGQTPNGRPILSAAAFHGDNLCWHAGSVLLLFGLCRRLTAATGRSFLVAALFALHPMHVESVAWAAERKDVLSTFFGILTLCAYVHYAARPGRLRLALVAAVYALSLLSKPMLMTLPFALLLLDYWPLRRLASATPAPTKVGEPSFGKPVAWGRLLLEKAPLFFLAAASGVVTVVARDANRAAVPLSALPLTDRVANAVIAYGWYLTHTLLPWRLAVLYPHPYRDWSVPWAVAGAAALLVLSALAVWQARRRRYLLVGWLWFVGALLPVIGLAQGGDQAWADRFSYWPHIGLFLALVWGLGELADHYRLPARVRALAGALVLGGLALTTWVQVGHWHDVVTLWDHALAVTEDNHPAHSNLGAFYLQREQLDRAEYHFAEAVRIRPLAPRYQNGLGVTLLALGREEEAAEHLQEAVRISPESTDAWYHLGLVRLRQDRPADAAECFRQLLERQPHSPDSLALLGKALWAEGKRPAALEAFHQALGLNPGESEAWSGLGVAHLAEGEPAEAAEAFTQAIRYRPAAVKSYSELGLALGRSGHWREAVSAHVRAMQMNDQGERYLAAMNGRAPAPDGIPQGVTFRCRLAYALDYLGDRPAAEETYRAALRRDPNWPRQFTTRAWALATARDANLRDPQLALEMATQARAAVEYPSAALLDTLAAAQAALGKFPEAIRTAQQALDHTSAGGDDTQADAIREHLKFYQQGKAVTADGP